VGDVLEEALLITSLLIKPAGYNSIRKC